MTGRIKPNALPSLELAAPPARPTTISVRVDGAASTVEVPLTSGKTFDDLRRDLVLALPDLSQAASSRPLRFTHKGRTVDGSLGQAGVVAGDVLEASTSEEEAPRRCCVVAYVVAYVLGVRHCLFVQWRDIKWFGKVLGKYACCCCRCRGGRRGGDEEQGQQEGEQWAAKRVLQSGFAAAKAAAMSAAAGAAAKFVPNSRARAGSRRQKVAAQMAAFEQTADALWAKYDADGSGFIDAAELRTMMEDMNAGPCSPKPASRSLRRALLTPQVNSGSRAVHIYR